MIDERSNRPIATPLQKETTPPSPDPYRQEVRRRRLKLALVWGGVLAVVALLAGWNVHSAAAHYARGCEALEAERFSLAIQELNAARVLAFPYRDAEELAAEAAEALNSGMQREAQRQKRLDDAVRGLVKLADTDLGKGDVAAAEQALADARSRVPEGQLSEDSFTLTLLHTLAQRLTTICRQALAEGRWGVAETGATALLWIDPGDDAGLRFTEKARRGVRLQARLDDARDAADDGEWRRALRLAQSVLASWSGFPGAESLVREAKEALRPKPSPSATTAVATPTPTIRPPATTAPPPPP